MVVQPIVHFVDGFWWFGRLEDAEDGEGTVCARYLRNPQPSNERKLVHEIMNFPEKALHVSMTCSFLISIPTGIILLAIMFLPVTVILVLAFVMFMTFVTKLEINGDALYVWRHPRTSDEDGLATEVEMAGSPIALFSGTVKDHMRSCEPVKCFSLLQAAWNAKALARWIVYSMAWSSAFVPAVIVATYLYHAETTEHFGDVLEALYKFLFSMPDNMEGFAIIDDLKALFKFDIDVVFKFLESALDFYSQDPIVFLKASRTLAGLSLLMVLLKNAVLALNEFGRTLAVKTNEDIIKSYTELFFKSEEVDEKKWVRNVNRRVSASE